MIVSKAGAIAIAGFHRSLESIVCKNVVRNGEPRCHREEPGTGFGSLVGASAWKLGFFPEQDRPLGSAFRLLLALGFAIRQQLHPAMFGEDLFRGLALEDGRDGLFGGGRQIFGRRQLALQVLGFRENGFRDRWIPRSGLKEGIDGDGLLLRWCSTSMRLRLLH